MIVVDTCVITHLFNATELTPLAQQVLEIDPNWIFPPLWEDEYANVLSKLARKETTPVHEVVFHYASVVSQLKNNERFADKEHALTLSIALGISAYDAQFLALAIDYETLLVTEDKILAKRCPEYAISMQKFIRK